MKNLSIADIIEAKFELYPGNPVVKRFGLSTVVADPCVLTPDVTHDGKWYMFAHTLAGVYCFSSEDGISFTRRRRAVGDAMRPYVVREGEEYLIFYERVQPLLARGLTLLGGDWKSEIYLVRSRDLTRFSAPEKVLAYDLPHERTGKDGYSLSNPYILKEDGKYRLYYSSGLTYIEDCKFSEPTYICLAESGRADGGYIKRGTPIISPMPDSRLFSLCCGCLKVYRMKDGYIGLQNGLYTAEDGGSGSAVQLLRSDDGINFSFVKTLLAPLHDGGWMSRFVYASHLVRAGDSLRLYFNARNTADMLRGTEHIGFAEARLPRA